MKSRPKPVPREAFDAAYRRHFGFVWRMLRYHGVAPEAMEDAVQDVFVVVHRRWHQWDREHAERAWLFGIVRRVAAAHRRSASRHRRRLEVAPAPTPATSPEDQVAGHETLETLHAALDALGEATRTAFVLATIEGLSAPEIAELTGAKLNTVYSRVRAAKVSIAAALERTARSES